MISIQTVLYLIIVLLLVAWIAYDFNKEIEGGNYSSGKRGREVGWEGVLAFISLIVFTLIWGGIYWW